MIEAIARRERLAVVAGLAFTVVAGLWATLATGDLLMQPEIRGSGLLSYGALLFLMWWSMMMAMMLPSAAPALLSYAAIARKAREGTSLGLFAAGYAAVWTVFSLAAVLLQIVSRDLFPLTGMMALVSRMAGGALLIGAGLYQFTGLKQACLGKCQQPFFWLAHNWRKGAGGAFRMGVSHGVYCLGCCWVLMFLLFYGGVMELSWILGLALFVAAEKMLPAALKLDRAAGGVLVIWGGFVLGRALLN